MAEPARSILRSQLTLGTRLALEQDEISSIKEIAKHLESSYETVEAPAFQAKSALYAHEFPRRVREALHDFKLREDRAGLLVISGYPIDDDKIGPTPDHWDRPEPRRRVVEEEMILVLLGSLLGDCIGWSTQQAGRLVHDILPIQGHEGEQLGSGSEQPLWWHVEDAFHPYRGDYLGMACLRNTDRVATTYASLEGIELPSEILRYLFEPHFTIRPDESHLVKNKARNTGLDDHLESSYAVIEQMNSAPEKISVLFGDPRAPYIRIDPYFMDAVTDCPAAQEALDALVEAIDAKLCDLVLQPGDFGFIDNFLAVHGRKPFKARFDGTDRWMKRINITRDLRKSRAVRRSPESRIVA